MYLLEKFEENVSSLFEDYYSYPLVKNILSKFIDTFFIVYERHNERFKKVFEQELDSLIKVLVITDDIFLPLIREYENDIRAQASKKKYNGREIKSRIKRTKIILFSTEQEMESFFKKIKGKCYLGLNKEALSYEIDKYFRDIEYCLDVAEKKSYLIDKYRKYELYNLAYFIYEDSKGKFKYSTALGCALNDEYFKSNSNDPRYQGFRNFIRSKNDLKQFKDQVKKRYQNSLQNLQ